MVGECQFIDTCKALPLQLYSAPVVRAASSVVKVGEPVRGESPVQIAFRIRQPRRDFFL